MKDQTADRIEMALQILAWSAFVATAGLLGFVIIAILTNKAGA